MSLKRALSDQASATTSYVLVVNDFPLVFDGLPDSAYVREAQIVQSSSRPNSAAPLPFSSPTLWRKVKAGTFPKPIKLSERVTAWKVGHIRAWLNEQEAA
jgi:prophage regulatory protein